MIGLAGPARVTCDLFSNNVTGRAPLGRGETDGKTQGFMKTVARWELNLDKISLVAGLSDAAPRGYSNVPDYAVVHDAKLIVRR
jgi:hypothetical protein